MIKYYLKYLIKLLINDQSSADQILQKGGDKKCVNQETAKRLIGLGNVTAAAASADAVHFSDVSYPQKRNKKSWKNTGTSCRRSLLE